MSEAKPFCISKKEVWEAYKRVKANKGAAGVDVRLLFLPVVRILLSRYVLRIVVDADLTKVRNLRSTPPLSERSCPVNRRCKTF